MLPNKTVNGATPAKTSNSTSSTGASTSPLAPVAAPINSAFNAQIGVEQGAQVALQKDTAIVITEGTDERKLRADKDLTAIVRTDSSTEPPPFALPSSTYLNNALLGIDALERKIDKDTAKFYGQHVSPHFPSDAAALAATGGPQFVSNIQKIRLIRMINKLSKTQKSEVGNLKIELMNLQNKIAKESSDVIEKSEPALNVIFSVIFLCLGGSSEYDVMVAMLKMREVLDEELTSMPRVMPIVNKLERILTQTPDFATNLEMVRDFTRPEADVSPGLLNQDCFLRTSS